MIDCAWWLWFVGFLTMVAGLVAGLEWLALAGGASVLAGLAVDTYRSERRKGRL